MRPRYPVAALMLCGFLAVVLAIAFLNHRYSPVSVVAGEDSVGTWASGMLLVVSATISLTRGFRLPWPAVALFFLVLALDERFMFHESLKARLIMQYKLDPLHPGLVAELPVMVGALVGAIVSLILWRRFQKTGKILIAIAVIFGLSSVVIDVFSFGVFWEDIFKLIAELAVACAFLSEV
jgi:hypothetical protein